jgi:hypothetical protein
MGRWSERTPRSPTAAVERTPEPSLSRPSQRADRLAQKGTALGAGGCNADRLFTRINPVDSATLQPTQNGRPERSNHPRALRMVDGGAGGQTARARTGGMVQEANARGKAAGYADVDHDSRNVEPQVGVDTS